MVSAGEEESMARSMAQSMGEPHLTLVGTVEYAGDLGTGSVFWLTAREAAGPVEAGEAVLVKVLVTNDPLATLFRAHPTPAAVLARFELLRTDEEYGTPASSGFVDRAGSSWRLEEVTLSPPG